MSASHPATPGEANMGAPGSVHGSYDTVVDADGIASTPPSTTEKLKNNPTTPPGPKMNEKDEKTSSGEDEEEETDEVELRHSIVRDLARQYTNTSHHFQGSHADLFAADDANSPLNPQSDNFNARAWAKAVAKAMGENGSGFRQSGICFQDMNVFGYGAETDYQKDVGNVWLEIPSLARNLLSPNRGKRRIDILRGFDGVVNKGRNHYIHSTLGPSRVDVRFLGNYIVDVAHIRPGWNGFTHVDL